MLAMNGGHVCNLTFPVATHKEKILKTAREKQQITYNGIPIRLTPDLSAETL